MMQKLPNLPAFSNINRVHNLVATTVNMQRFIPSVTAREIRGRSALNMTYLVEKRSLLPRKWQRMPTERNLCIAPVCNCRYAVLLWCDRWTWPLESQRLHRACIVLQSCRQVYMWKHLVTFSFVTKLPQLVALSVAAMHDTRTSTPSSCEVAIVKFENNWG